MKRLSGIGAVVAHIEGLLGPDCWPGLAKWMCYVLIREEWIISAPDGYYVRTVPDHIWLALLTEGIEYAA